MLSQVADAQLQGALREAPTQGDETRQAVPHPDAAAVGGGERGPKRSRGEGGTTLGSGMTLSSEQQNLLALHSGEQQPPASKQLLSNDAYVTVLQRADGEHISGKLDLEDHISGLQDCIRQLQREPELTKEARGFKVINAVRGSATGIAVTFDSAPIAAKFKALFSKGGFTVKGLNYKTTSASDFYLKVTSEDAEMEDKSKLVIVLRGIPDAGAELSNYVMHAEESYGKVEKTAINEHEWGGVGSGFEDGSLLLVVKNEKQVKALAPTPLFIGGAAIGKLSFMSGQVHVVNHKYCKAENCRAIDGQHVVGCDYKERKEFKEKIKVVAQRRQFSATLKENAQQVQGVRKMLKIRAEKEGHVYCGRYNQKGVPCTACKLFPCNAWDELMQTTLSNSVYANMPAAARGRHGGAKKPTRRGGGKGEKRKVVDGFSDDDLMDEEDE